MPDDPLSEITGASPVPQPVRAPRPTPTESHLPDLLSFAKERGLAIASTTGGTHNAGSLHYSGNAIDIHNSGSYSDQQVAELSQAASQRGFKLRDERVRPAGQKVWGGPHVHIEYSGAQAQDPLTSITTASPTPRTPTADPLSQITQGSPAAPSTRDQSILTDEQKRTAIAAPTLNVATRVDP